MEFSFEELEVLCLPWESPSSSPSSMLTDGTHAAVGEEAGSRVGKCYTLFLSTTGTDFFPSIEFLGAKEATGQICPHRLLVNVTFATVCIDGAGQRGNVTFYSHNSSANYYGMFPMPATILQQVLHSDNMINVGFCEFPVKFVSQQLGGDYDVTDEADVNEPSLAPTDSWHSVGEPSLEPSQEPTMEPTSEASTEPTPSPSSELSLNDPVPSSMPPSTGPTAAPTHRPTVTPTHNPTVHVPNPTSAPTPDPSSLITFAPQTIVSTSDPTATSSTAASATNSYGGMDFECMSSCSDFPGSDLFTSSVMDACDFLVTSPFDLCSGFSIAYGSCPVPACAGTCLKEVWCYFGTGAVVNCPSSQWKDATPELQSMRTQCQQNFKPYVSKSSYANKTSSQATQKSEINVGVVAGELPLHCRSPSTLHPNYI